jgi:2-polyprenyl-3-methyl-5-hydroxy-6-metoxy-1,4-benzoquinol methylase
LYYDLEIQNKKYAERQKNGTVFDSEGYDWEKYIRNRPIYSNDFLNIILEYHRQKNDQLMLAAHDIGTGPGNVAQYLAQHFETVYASDSSKRNLDNARQRVSSTH